MTTPAVGARLASLALIVTTEARPVRARRLSWDAAGVPAEWCLFLEPWEPVRMVPDDAKHGGVIFNFLGGDDWYEAATENRTKLDGF